ncbi:hypothetical protein C2G38_2056703 [Gigaspora rosea]|uniref:Protein kinase domain-containing protein n=1 Tax=Gigaspora rosea TaxID=44941 RepID=A0A397W433_9GLOM|nr:hypothetical protein C2G38_2056703 [Gigaspora rosea]
MDIWSLGCIIFELYTKTPLFYSEEVIDKLTKSFTRGELVDFPLNKIPDQQARNILSKMLVIIHLKEFRVNKFFILPF